ncbi:MULTISPECIES: DUF4870 domain-containing protein [Bizionia]|uniref:DUF4870 domain-containing protein n=1 Tax=Bizionia algoritergicola TaxID=291187 RepID=A0A5D0QRB0_9FLAO|nr:MULTISPECIES: DUF4870 domain-containing protein [Bizionia]OBX17518.1 hypothetical protein BAA08_16220 [Bizionia sp. APA-3]TYB71743.1 DUF4870 domain-containing protein [Bizionia algoritergicola]
MIDNHQKNLATFIHLSTFTRFLIPFGNFIGPLVLWVMNKDKSEFVDAHGKQAINFQMSILLYALIIGMVTIPFFIFNLISGFDFLDINTFDSIRISITKPSPLLYITGGLGFLAIIGFILELVFIVKAALSARDGQAFQYPLTIKFLK